MLSWMNGEFMLAENMKISPFEHGYLYGIGFFETLRTYEGEPLFIEQHYSRLMEALESYHINMPYTLDELKHVIAVLTDAAAGEDGYFRINVAAGDYGIGLQPNVYDRVTVIVMRKDLPPQSVAIQEKELVVLNTRRNNPEQVERYKGHHYGNNVKGRLELSNLKDYEGLFLSNDGYVAEGITSNIFWSNDGVLYTPTVELGILPGITRTIVMELAAALDLQVVQGRFNLQELLEADEVFVTNSIQELVPIAHMQGSEFEGTDGEIFKQLNFAYHHHIQTLLRRE